MDTDEAKKLVTTVEVSSEETRQLEEYEPTSVTVGMEAEVPESEDVEEIEEALRELCREKTREEMVTRQTEWLKQQSDL